MVNTVRAVITFVDSNDRIRDSWTADRDGVVLVLFMTDDGSFDIDYVQVGSTVSYARNSDYRLAYGSAHSMANVTYCLKSLAVRKGETVTISSKWHSSGLVDLEYAVVVFLSAS